MLGIKVIGTSMHVTRSECMVVGRMQNCEDEVVPDLVISDSEVVVLHVTDATGESGGIVRYIVVHSLSAGFIVRSEDGSATMCSNDGYCVIDCILDKNTVGHVVFMLIFVIRFFYNFRFCAGSVLRWWKRMFRRRCIVRISSNDGYCFMIISGKIKGDIVVFTSHRFFLGQHR